MNSKLRKFIALCTAVALVLASISGCTAKKDSNDSSANTSEVQAVDSEKSDDVPIEEQDVALRNGEESSKADESKTEEKTDSGAANDNSEGSKQEDESSHEHAYTKEVVSEATCTEAGEVAYKCECGDTYTEKTEAIGHSYTTETVPATYEVGGYTVYTCTRCGYTYTGDYTDKLSSHTHSYSGTVTKEATCESEGVKTYTCSCGSYYTESISALGHDWKDTVVAPTTEAEGYTLHECTRCGESYKDSVTAKLSGEDNSEEQGASNYPEDPDYPFHDIYSAAYDAKSGILEFRDENGTDMDFYFTEGMILEGEWTKDEIYDTFWGTILGYTGYPEDGDALYWRFKQRGSRTFIDKVENGYTYVQIVVYGDLNTTADMQSALLGSLDCGASGSTLERAYTVYNWCYNNTTWGRWTEGGREVFMTAYGARFGTATCIGIASLVYDMMLYAGVPCTIEGDNSHAWNEVKIDGTWYKVDATQGVCELP